jgi:hypothetical protein
MAGAIRQVVMRAMAGPRFARIRPRPSPSFVGSRQRTIPNQRRRCAHWIARFETHRPDRCVTIDSCRCAAGERKHRRTPISHGGFDRDIQQQRVRYDAAAALENVDAQATFFRSQPQAQR